MIRYHASWILPIAGPPLRDGWVAVDRDRVVACGAEGDDAAAVDGAREIDLGEVAILPGLVNAHTHLELSYLGGKVPRGSSFVAWIRTVMAARRQFPDPRAPEILEGVDTAIEQAHRTGTAVVGDISNTLVTFEPIARSSLAGVVFYELIGFRAPDPAAVIERAIRQIAELPPSRRVRASLAAHAPYSVAPLLLRAIRESLDRDPSARCSVHLAESAEEVEFLVSGGGAWRQLLEDFGVWDSAWVPPGGSPVEYLDEHGLLSDRVLAVHGVQMTPADLERLAVRGTTLVACPRSNDYTGAGRPPIAAFYASGVRVALGTDSLASTPDLNMFSELAAMRRLAPAVPASMLLDSATRQGAAALGLDDEFGTIQAGKSARLLAIDLPAGAGDVEEYLVGGIESQQVGWVNAHHC